MNTADPFAGRTGEPYTWTTGDNTCFGCSPTNPRGLGLDFWRLPDDSVECRWVPEAEMNGAPGIVHGGLQAALLDECMGYACHTQLESFTVVTAEMNLRYRGPVHTGTPVIGSARVDRREGRNLFLKAWIRDLDDRDLTTAEARFVCLDPPSDSEDG